MILGQNILDLGEPDHTDYSYSEEDCPSQCISHTLFSYAQVSSNEDRIWTTPCLNQEPRNHQYEDESKQLLLSTPAGFFTLLPSPGLGLFPEGHPLSRDSETARSVTNELC